MKLSHGSKLKYKSKRGISEIISNLIISITIASIALSAYIIGINYTSNIINKINELNVKELAISITKTIDKLEFENETLKIEIRFQSNPPIIIKSLGNTSLSINNQYICTWNNSKIIIPINQYSPIKLPILGKTSIFSINKSSISIMHINSTLEVNFNIKVILTKKYLHIKIYSLNEEKVIIKNTVIFKVKSIVRKLIKIHCPNSQIILTIIKGNKEIESITLNSKYNEIHALIELIKLEVN